MATASNGDFVWYDNLAADASRSVAFYTELTGWRTQPFGDDYTMWLGSQGPLGGVMTLPPELVTRGVRPHWMGSVQVADVDASVVLAISLGATVHKAPDDIPTVGRFAVIADPQGVPIQLFAPSQPMTAHDPGREGEVCWRELMTSDSAAALSFYAQIFGWAVVQEMDMGPMGTYRIFGIGDRMLGGMMTVPPGTPMPPMWLYYVETADLEAAVARATRLGATLMNGPMDVPGGRIVQLADPDGAPFALHHATRA